MPTSKNQQVLNVGLPPKLLESFWEAMPMGYNKNMLVAAALEAFRSLDRAEIHGAIEKTVTRYEMATKGESPQKLWPDNKPTKVSPPPRRK